MKQKVIEIFENYIEGSFLNVRQPENPFQLVSCDDISGKEKVDGGSAKNGSN